MKPHDFKTLALLGLTGGLVFISKDSIKADLPLTSSNYLVAVAAQKAKCPGKNGCPGIVADRDKTSSNQPQPTKDDYNSNDSNVGYHLFSEDELLLELNDEETKMYNQLSPEGKKMALTVSSMRCAKTNPCAGLNACATDKNDCAGKGSCKGQKKCAVSDKNLAVKLVYEKMQNKRSKAIQKQR